MDRLQPSVERPAVPSAVRGTDLRRCLLTLIAALTSSPLKSPGLGAFDLCFPGKEGSGSIPGAKLLELPDVHTPIYQPRFAWAAFPVILNTIWGPHPFF